MSLNKVILIGYVGRDPEIRYFDSESATASFSLATVERGYRLKNGTEIPDRTDWHNIVAHRDWAQFAEKWVKKGSVLLVEGRIRYRSYVDKQSVRHDVTEIVAERISFYDNGTSRTNK